MFSLTTCWVAGYQPTKQVIHFLSMIFTDQNISRYDLCQSWNQQTKESRPKRRSKKTLLVEMEDSLNFQTLSEKIYRLGFLKSKTKSTKMLAKKGVAKVGTRLITY